MLLLTIAMFFAIAALAPFIARIAGERVFFVTALVPLGGFVALASLMPRVYGGEEIVERLDWIPQLGISLTWRLDALSMTLGAIVTGVGLLVTLYCRWYFLREHGGIGRFAGVFSAFAGSMLALVLADDVYVLFVAWELTSVFSFLLISHYIGKRSGRWAAMQALLVTTLGGLVMLIGIIVLSVEAGTTSLREIVEHPVPGPMTTAAVLLVLVGAMTKSAIFPFHFWLPGAMAAPTPVSAYLHAAAMVKGGIYLVLRLAPGFADTPGFREALTVAGVISMLVGGLTALKQNDLKLVLAYGTVSQLGFLTVISAQGTRDTALAALALLLAHALFKSALFLIVGIIDHRVGTRDLRKISGLGRSAPGLAVVTVVALASMMGLPPLFGFVAKEAVLTTLLDLAHAGDWVALAGLIGVALGSVLTLAYSLRFFWGAYAAKPDVEVACDVPERAGFLVAPALLAFAGFVAGVRASDLDAPLAGYADTVHPAGLATLAAEAETSAGGRAYHLALWHGLEPALFISLATIALGVLVFTARGRRRAVPPRAARIGVFERAYGGSLTLVDRTARRVTATTQRGSLPFYLRVILSVFVVVSAVALVAARGTTLRLVPFDSPAELPIAGLMAVAAVGVAISVKRFQAAVLIGVTGYGIAALFALRGAPDLALTQVLVETITVVAFMLVLRRLPARLGQAHSSVKRVSRAVLGILVGLAMALIAIVAISSREASQISLDFGSLAKHGGHGENIVNVMLVDIRGWDTLGELSVMIAAATGVASLVFLFDRGDDAIAGGSRLRRGGLEPAETGFTSAVSVEERHSSVPGGRRRGGRRDPGENRASWLVAGRTLLPQNRSIILEVGVRLIFHALIIVSLYLLFAGHNLPGGGFAGGLVAGIALAARYFAGGRHELAEAAPISAGALLGSGLTISALTALVPLFFGADALTSTWIDAEIPAIGHFVFVTSTLFDIGVYLVVVGLMLDVLRSLGSQVDRDIEDDAIEVERSAGLDHGMLEREVAKTELHPDDQHASLGGTAL